MGDIFIQTKLLHALSKLLRNRFIGISIVIHNSPKNGVLISFQAIKALLTALSRSYLAARGGSGSCWDILYVGAPYGLLASEVSALNCAIKASYNWLQAQRIQQKEDVS